MQIWKTSFISLIAVSMLLQNAFATPQAPAGISTTVIEQANQQVLRVKVTRRDGRHGLGSAVVIAAQKVVTNCHVVTDAQDVKVIFNQQEYTATALSPDWKHDLCVLSVPNLAAPQATLANSEQLHYDSAVFTAGFPETSDRLVNTFGAVQGLFPMDGAMIIRASSSFNLGESGGGMFDESGRLVGIITLKSRGAHAQYFYMPVEWVISLMTKPTQTLGLHAEKPFWAAEAKQRPFFMQVVEPAVSHDWEKLSALSQVWVQQEPEHAESWLALATAEYELHQYERAQQHFVKVAQLRQDCSSAQAYLSKIAKQVGLEDKIAYQVSMQ